ncbi:HET-domain-containing protein, partial [Cucurbitaria berberidis CBS 394.84]
MRLINATTLKLHSFIDDSQHPKYAILSHTWGSEEVTFEQLRNARHADLERMSGFRKILLASQQTLRDGLDYVWVDTCCIDKTSSAELSESINSMFRWYKNATICYAYLDDVDVVEDGPEPFIDKYRGLVREYIKEEELASAKWFTRGWTLQELLAPNVLYFYARGWKFVGDKDYLEPKLARITGIDIDALDPGKKLDNYSVATRMSWAASRKTTRAEDMAYCLLGLFDVNMPLLYGEGGHKAFTRLQQEVLEDSSDCSIFAW